MKCLKTNLACSPCYNCPIHCNLCSSASSCTECVSPYILSESWCVSTCPKRTYSSNDKCQGKNLKFSNSLTFPLKTAQFTVRLVLLKKPAKLVIKDTLCQATSVFRPHLFMLKAQHLKQFHLPLKQLVVLCQLGAL